MKRKYQKIEFASQVGIEQYEDMVDDFLKRIFNYEGRVFITDESRVSDFMELDEEEWFNSTEEASKHKPTKEDEEKFEKRKQEIAKKIEEIYDVDILDIEDLNLAKVLQRIRIIKNI